jgi:sugar phosphate isomerase/epimerase
MNEIGVMLNNLEPDRLRAFAVAARHGFREVHTSTLREHWLHGPERAQYVAAAHASGVQVVTMFVGFDGQSYTDLPAIARTVGFLAIPELREHRRAVALAYSALAREVGAESLGGHLGFFPHDPAHPDYAWLVDTVRQVLDCCAANGQTFRLETGQESADVLLQFLRAVDRPNLGVNFDPANFLLYGTDEPLAALDRLAPFVWGVHCKDALRSRQPGKLGTEVLLGQGEVDFPAFLRRLREHGYDGPLVIEREHGPNVLADVLGERAYLKRLLAGEQAAIARPG